MVRVPTSQVKIAPFAASSLITFATYRGWCSARRGYFKSISIDHAGTEHSLRVGRFGSAKEISAIFPYNVVNAARSEMPCSRIPYRQHLLHLQELAIRPQNGRAQWMKF